MDQFYLANAALYQTLVSKFNPGPVPQQLKENNEKSTPAPANITVSARIRPLLSDDIDAGFPCAVFPRPGHAGMADVHDLYNHPRGRPILKSFNYTVDILFPSKTTTEEIYHSLVHDLVPYAWNGGIGTLFTYGQTGSGKTFTVTGLERLVAQSLMDGSLVQGSLDGGGSHNGGSHSYGGHGGGDERQISLSIIDLAGNSAYDLLNARNPVSILEDSAGLIQLAGATERQVHGRHEMLSLIETAASFRRTASTFKNDASSRSHAICRIVIKTRHTQGLLYLVDLAGSEAARDVASHGADRMRETREINMSLSVLKDCIRGKAESDLAKLKLHSQPLADEPKPKQQQQQAKPHIPIRQSALTKVLKHVFDPEESRPCKTVVIACLNPSLADVGPSKNTLRYAEMLRVMDPNTANNNTTATATKVERNLMGGYRKVRA